MIERLDIKDYENKEQLVWFGVINKINALVDAVNGILDYAPLEMAMKAEPEPDQYKSITYMSDGHIKKFYGHDSIVELEVPLPQGTRITIKSITKGGDNDNPAN